MRVSMNWRIGEIKERIPSKSFKNVRRVLLRDNRVYFLADISVKGKRLQAYYETEREAAIAVDKVLINAQKPPVNVLKKKK